MEVQSVAPLMPTLGPSPCSPVEMAQIQQDSSPSLYAAFKLARLVNSFRRRIQTRVLSHRRGKENDSQALQEGFCHAFERQAFEAIDHYLGRKTHHGGKGRVRSKPASSTKSESANACSESAPPPRPIRSNSIQRYVTVPIARHNLYLAHIHLCRQLNHLDAKLLPIGDSLSALAADSGLLLQKGTKIDLCQLRKQDLFGSLGQLESLLISVRDAYQHWYSSEKTNAQDGDTIRGHRWSDLLYLANLEHLLLCLRGQVLLALFIGHGFAEIIRHILECQQRRRRTCKEWFFVYPDVRHPLSTTWPWNIRPSLVVLWGVCWMFDPYSDYDVDREGNIVNKVTNEIIFEEESPRSGIEEFAVYEQPGKCISHSPDVAASFSLRPLRSKCALHLPLRGSERSGLSEMVFVVVV